MNIFNLLLIAIALSMDTFSLSLYLGIVINNKKKIVTYLLGVVLFHFFFPIIGNILSLGIIKLLAISSNKLLGIIFLILSIKLIIDIKNDDLTLKDDNVITLLILSILVSIDSFITGIGILINNILPPFIFSIISGLFTIFGLIIGKYAKENLGKKANILGLILLIILSILHLCK